MILGRINRCEDAHERRVPRNLVQVAYSETSRRLLEIQSTEMRLLQVADRGLRQVLDTLSRARVHQERTHVRRISQ